MAFNDSKILLDIEVLLNNPNTKTSIEIGGGSFSQKEGGVLLTGFLTSTPSFGGSNQYSTPLDNDKIANLNNFVGIASGVATGTSGGVRNFIIKSQIQTANIWTGSGKFAFDLQLTFVSYKIKDDNIVLKAIRTLLSCVFPQSTGNASFEAVANVILNPSTASLNATTIAPRGYTTYTEPKTGTILAFGTHAVKIGRWFYAKDLNITNVRIDVSPEPRTDGKPVYAIATVSFESFKMISEKEVLSYFIDPK